MAFLRQLGLLMWKTGLQQWRKKCVAVFEIILPLVFAVMFMSLRFSTDNKPVQYKPEAMFSGSDSVYNTLTIAPLVYTPNNTLVNELMMYISSIVNKRTKYGFPGGATGREGHAYAFTRTPGVITDCHTGETHRLSSPGKVWKYRSFQNFHLDILERTIFPNHSRAGKAVCFSWVSAFQVYGFANSEEMLSFYNKHPLEIGAAIQFMDVKMEDSILPKTIRFAIRPDSSDVDWKTHEIYPTSRQWIPRPGIYPGYEYESSFLDVQRLVHDALISHWNPNATAILERLDIQLQRMPYPSYVEDKMSRLLQEVLPALLLLSFIFIAVQTTKDIVEEKERKIKESMKLMGLSSAAHWVSWFLFRFLQMTIIMALFTVFCCVDMSGNGAPFLKSDPSVVFVFLLCYGVAIISYCFMISVFVRKGTNGAAISGIVFFVSYCPYLYLAYAIRFRNMSINGHQAFCLIFNLGMAYGAHLIALYEGFGTGAQWSNINQSPTANDNFPLLHAMLILLLDTVIHLTITWYVDNVRPGEFGVPKPWYFPFTAAYWCDKKSVHLCDCSHSYELPSVEEQHGNMKGISIRNLRKVFGSGAKTTVAVGGINLEVAEEQITVLVGPNGAGKTTTMSILTGFVPPTDGTAFVNGYDLSTDIESVRQSLGLCPQHNILFDTLTVQEHLEFFASLKGHLKGDQKSEVEKMIQEVGLSSKRNTQSQHLSGGQKRKLSVGIALIGGSKIVILDEPTSGMDPAARRQTWDILQKNRQGRTMLLTTHFMDEADLLGDRIAIMAQGVIKCDGTSYDLKKRYGAGYHLVLVKETTCQVPSVTETVQGHIPTAVIESEINAELSYLLPEHQSPKFAELFTEIEERSVELGISSFGTTATTMEEVFIKVVDANDDVVDHTSLRSLNNTPPNLDKNSDIAMSEFGSREDIIKNQEIEKLTGFSLELSRLKGLIVKKMLHSWRNRIITTVQFLLPLGMIIFALVVAKTSKGEAVALTLDLSPFHGSYVPYWKANTTSSFINKLYTVYPDLFKGTENKIENGRKYPNTTQYFLSKAQQLGLDRYNTKMVIGARFTSDRSLTAYYNGQPYHAEPISLSYLMNAILKYFTSEDYSIKTIMNPLPSTTSVTYDDVWIGATISFIFAFCIFFGMTFLTSSFVHLPIKERQVGAKHLQILSGVRPILFWASNFIWDYANYMTMVVVMLILFTAFQIPAYSDGDRMGIFFLVLFVYGLASLPFMYTLQFLFKSPAIGMVVTIIFNIITGLTTLMAVYMLDIYGQTDEAKKMDWVCTVLFAHHNFGKCIENIYVNFINLNYCIGQNYRLRCAPSNSSRQSSHPCCKDNCGSYCVPFVENDLDWESPGIGRHITFMIIHAVVFTTATLCIEYRIPQRIWYILKPRGMIASGERTSSEDDDITVERRRINQIQIGSKTCDPLVLKDLSKYYGNFIAVDNLSAGISEKECFGLLGQNGAGKTSTFKLLTGDLMVTNGNAYLWSYDIKGNTRKVQENMGYCPQFDALLDQMTGRETLTMYARLRGVPQDRIGDVCDNLLDNMGLKSHADKLTSDYSGGNKRKLSTAIALVGNPAFIMLDEPSTGMDPRARRELWNVLSRVRSWGRTLVLTSHSMEECEALCTRLAIMVNGHFECLGTPQHLKNKFGQGYTLIARMSMLPDGQNTASTQPLVDFVKSIYTDTQVFDDFQGYVHFQVPYTSASLAQVFTLMEQAKVQFSVEDYSVHQTTLEQVFLKLTRDQIPPKEQSKGLLKRVCC